MADAAARGGVINPAGVATGSFDATSITVFASLCRVTASDRTLAEELLRAAYVLVDQRTDIDPDDDAAVLQSLLLTAHRLYLTHPTSSDTSRAASRSDAVYAQADWLSTRWAAAVVALESMTAAERVALNLLEVHQLPMDVVATVFDDSPDRAAAVLASGRATIAAHAPDETAVDVFRHAEVWLDDRARQSVRSALDAQQALTPRQRSRADRAHHPRPRRTAAVAAVIAGVLLAVVVRWVSTDSSDESDRVDFVAPTTVLDAPPSVADGGPMTGANGLVDPVRLGVTQGEAIVLHTDLSDSQTVVPDTIVRYNNGRVGMSWTGPCNRPALLVNLVNVDGGVGVRLITAEFPVVSCLGMPQRWTLVVRPAQPLNPGAIMPIGEDGAVARDFEHYSVAMAPDDVDPNAADEPTRPSSALVDDAQKPWVFGIGCTVPTVTRYSSPDGPLFEIAALVDAGNFYAAGDEMICERLRDRPILFGPETQFPQMLVATINGPIDCKGPFGSMTDVATPRTSATGPYAGRWTTFDGCLVRTDVIHSMDAPEECGWDDVRTLTFASTIGERIGLPEQPVSFLFDSLGQVPGPQEPLRNLLVAPKGATDTGLRFGKEQLWLVDDDLSSVYIVRGLTVQRWPRVEAPPTC